MRVMEVIQLTEQGAREVNLARRLKDQLSPEARSAIDTWESHNWVTGDLSTAYSQQNDVYREIERAAEPIRGALRAREGDTITLYRGIESDRVDPSRHADRAIYSWTSRPEMAAVFSGLATIGRENRVRLNKDRETSNEFMLSMTDAEAKAIQDAVIKNGKAKWKNLFFKTSPYNDQYTDILKKVNGRFKEMADELTTNLARWLIRTREEERQFSADVKAQGQDTGYVVREIVPVDDIVWVLNAAGSMEYIVKGRSGLEGERVVL